MSAPTVKASQEDIDCKSERAARCPSELAITAVGCGRIDQADEGNLLALLCQPAGHFIRNHSTKAIAAQTIRAVRLERSQIRQVGLSESLDGFQLFLPIQSAGLE